MKEQSGRKAGMLMDKTVFGYFKQFVSDDDEVRVKGACSLIEFLSNGQTIKQPDENNDAAKKEIVVPKTAETAYALKRLVRGVGSMQNDSRIGFFTALVGLLERLRGKEEECPTVTELFALVKAELTESGLEEDDGEKHKSRLELRIGKILVCGAIIKSGLIDDASELELQTVLKALKKDMYKMLTPMVYTFLIELANRLEAAKFTKVFWPIFEPVLNVPKENHTIDSVFFLLQLSTGPHKKLINRKYFDRNFGVQKLLHEDNFPFLSQLLFGIANTMGINHPFYECLLKELNKENAMVPFWRDAIVPVLEQENIGAKQKHRDIIVLRLVVSIFNLLEDSTLVPEVLQTAFVKFLVKNLKNRSKYSEDVRNLYQEVCTGLLQTYTKMEDDSVRLETLRRLMHAPGSVLIEKYSNCKLLHNLLTTLSAESLRTVAGELQEIILNEATGTNGERSYAAYMLQRLLSLRQLIAESGDKGQADAWHQDVVKFFLTLGVFYTADGVNMLKGSKQEKALSAELATTMRGLFFSSLEHRHPKLTVELSFLLSIVRHVDEVVRAHGPKCLRNVLTEEQMACWHKMYATVTNETAASKKQKGKKRASMVEAAGTECDMVFHILLMHMGLHLFSDPEVACSSIEELECVMKRIDEKAKQRRQSSNGEVKPSNGIKTKKSSALTIELEPAEPEWIEVVVDLLLNLLSQNSHLLRNVIAHLFPHLSSEMTIPALNQILSVINLKDKSNPLSVPGEDENDESETEELEDDEKSASEEDSESGEDEEGEEEEEEVGKSDEEDNDNDDDDDDEDIMGDEEEEENITDTMRQVIQTALGGANPETDTESVDLDELDEEQGRQLDKALTAAFRAFSKKKAARKRKGPTKAEKQMDTVLTHFRMRVLDLIDAYLKHEPDMLLCLELMLYIFEMLPVALREESKYGYILNRYRQIFTTLIRIKKFKLNAEDVRTEQLEQILRDLIEKVAKGVAFPERNQYLLKACQFIVICSQVLSKDATGGPNAVDTFFGELMVEFITNRNPSLAFSVFQSLFQIQWSGVWHLTGKLVHSGLKVSSVRAIRRIQSLQLLRQLLRNRRLLNADQARSAAELRSLCTDGLTPYVAQLEAAVVSGDRMIGQNELYELLLVLNEVQNLPTHLLVPSDVVSNGKKAAKKVQPLLNWENIGNQVQSMRLFALNSQTMTTYRQFCQRWHLQPITNEGLPSLKENGATTVETTNEENPTTNGDILPKQGKGRKQKTMNGATEAVEQENDAVETQRLVNGNGVNGDSGTEGENQQEGKVKRKKKKDKRTNGIEQEPEQNGEVGQHEEMEVNDEQEHGVSDDARVKRKRKKDMLQNGAATENQSSKKEKRRKKEALMHAASEGLEGFSFARVIEIE